MSTPIRSLFSISLVFLVHLSVAQSDSSRTKAPHHVLSFHPIFSHAFGNIAGIGDVFVGLHIGGEFRYGINLFNNRYRVGPSVKAFWDDGDGIQSSWSYLAGIYQQYNFLLKKHNRLYLETSFYYSNLCFCELGDFTIDATDTPSNLYVGIGAGWDIFLHPHWSFKLGAQYHILLNNPDALQRYWGQNVLAGIDYYFTPRPRRPNVVQRRAERRANRTARRQYLPH